MPTVYLMAVDVKAVIKRVQRGEPKRGRITLYLDKELLKDFQATCKRLEISSNRSLEELMRDFITSAQDTPPTKKSK